MVKTIALVFSLAAAVASADERRGWELRNDEMNPTQLAARHAYLLDERPWLSTPVMGLVFGSIGLTVSTAALVIGFAFLPAVLRGFGEAGFAALFLVSGGVGLVIATGIILVALSKLRSIHQIDSELEHIRELRLSRALTRPEPLATLARF